MVADPPPCDPGNPGRALAYCENVRVGQRCTCLFDRQALCEDLEALGLKDFCDQFDDEVDAESLLALAEELLTRVAAVEDETSQRLTAELLLLRQLAEEGSGVRPLDED